MPPPPKSLSIFTQAWSRMIHFYPLNPPMCQLRVRNVGLYREGDRVFGWYRENPVQAEVIPVDIPL